MSTIEIELYLDDECEWTEQVSLPARWEICPECAGNGTHDHPAFRNGLTASDWAEFDIDEREDYLRGAYDVQCEECGGSGKLLVVDEERVPEAYREAWARTERGRMEAAQERAWERRNLSLGIQF